MLSSAWLPISASKIYLELNGYIDTCLAYLLIKLTLAEIRLNKEMNEKTSFEIYVRGTHCTSVLFSST